MNEVPRDAPKHRWYQYSLLEMLLVTTILAAVLGILKLAHIMGMWLDLGALFLVGFYLVWALARLRRNCIDNGIWYPDPLYTEDDSLASGKDGQETEQ